MSISISDLAKQLNIAPEAIQLHAMDLDFEIGEDEMIPEDIATQIREIELGDELKQTEHELEAELDREIIEEQSKKTVGNQKKISRKKAKITKKEIEEERAKEVEIVQTDDGTIILDDEISVREFAIKINKPIPIVLVKLKQNGIVASLKDSIDYETAAIIASELDVKVKKIETKLSSEDLFRGDLATLLSEEDPELLSARPPVVSIMGHVDHGKTSVLDFIRKAKVAEGEAGGITQSIGAYQVEIDKQKITFLDTPGHEAFTIMRARGAKATDIAVLVVAATEGVKPQTIEAIAHAREAEIPIIVAINKMDMPGANLDKVKKELAEQDLNPEDWGGTVPCVPVSAKTGEGIDTLLDTILTVAEVETLKANPNRSAICTVIESFVNPKTGITATILVNTGTLKQGDDFVIHDQYGRIRTMYNYKSEVIKEATPSTPVQIFGLSLLPQTGDVLQVMSSTKEARKKAMEVADIRYEDDLSKKKKTSIATLKARIAEGNLQQLKIIAKTCTKGALEAVENEINKIKTETSIARVVHSGVGEITESDVMLARAGSAIIIGFGITISEKIRKFAEKENVELFVFDVIYHLTEHITDILENKKDDEKVKAKLGTFKIKAVFAVNKKMAVIGGDVVDGLIRKNLKFKILAEPKEDADETAEKEYLGEGTVESVQLGQAEVKNVKEGTECGMKLKHKELEFKEGMILEVFEK